MGFKKLNTSYRIGFGIAIFHFIIVMIVLLAMPTAGQSAIVLLFLLEKIDFFLGSIIYSLPRTNNTLVGLLQLFIVYGILGSLIWSAIPVVIGIFIDYYKRNKEMDKTESKD